MANVTRRELVLGGLGVGLVSLAGSPALSEPETQTIAAVKPGDFKWEPERSVEGPVSIIISLPDQLVHVYRNGVRIGISTCSTGKKGHETPTGVFTILEKDKHHHSSTYDNAPMPNMNRLTWSGVALHAGHLPGYPASHGCIRLPMKFSELLFGVTHVGTPVIIANASSQPRNVVHPGLVLADYAVREFDKVQSKLKGRQADWAAHVTTASAPASIVVSSADMQGILLVNGAVVAQRPVTIRDPAAPLGSNVFMLKGADTSVRGLAWQEISYDASARGNSLWGDDHVIQRISTDAKGRALVEAHMHPGMTLLTTDQPARAQTRTERGFVVMTTEPA
ncbi:MAG TPA: L,D-transpeptidase [Hyphomicrobiaceae bacterium]|nr:L,D-transpeptidase [Hyphomicrobiaceae bacterium]